MVYTYKPNYYSTSITSLCKSILSFSSKNRRLAGNRHSDNLKWQQDSFHRILNLIGLHKEGIIPESEVSTFRTHVLDTLISCPAHPESPGVVRDKLLFLQELFYAKCISSEQYHSSKRPLLHRLAVQGVEIDARDVIVGGNSDEPAEEEWSVIDLRDKDEISHDTKAKKLKRHASPLKGVKSLLGIGSRSKEKEGSVGPIGRNGEKGTVLMPECSEDTPRREKKKKVLGGLFQKERAEENGKDLRLKPSNSKKQWGGLRKWKRNGRDTNTPESTTVDHLLLENRPDDGSAVPCPLVGELSDTKKEIPDDATSSDFFVDKELVEITKKDQSRINSEPKTTNPNHEFRTWYDRCEDVVVDAVKEFKDHANEVEVQKNAVGVKRSSSGNWVTFEEENTENFHPNLCSRQNPPLVMNKKTKNPFDDEHHLPQSSCGSATKNPFQDIQQNNPFWAPSHC